MATYVQQNKDSLVRWTPPRRASSAVASFCSPQGTVLETLSPALDNVTLTVSAAGNGFSGTASGTGTLVPGRSYWMSDGTGNECLVRVATVDDDDFVLDGLPALPVAVGNVIRGAEFSATIAAASLATRGAYYRVEWSPTMADTTDVETYQQMIHVCRALFSPAMTPQRASEYCGAAFPAATRSRPTSWFSEIAERAARRVERLLVKSGRLPHLIGDHDMFDDAGTIALRLELALENLVPSGFDASTFQTTQMDELKREIDEATSQNWYDDNDDGAVQATEFASYTTIALVQR